MHRPGEFLGEHLIDRALAFDAGADLMYSLDANEAKSWVRAAFRIARTWKRIYTIGWVHPVDTARNSTGFLDWRGKQKSTYSAIKAG